MYYLLHLLSFDSGQTQAIIFAVMLFICWNIENIAGIATNYRKWNHAFLNSKFILTGVLPQFIMSILLVHTMRWTGEHHFGLLFYLHLRHYPVMSFLISFILMDFGEYVYHVIMHKTRRLWMFHAVHHSDTVVDVSTTLREHPGENLIRNSFTLVWLFFSGTFFWMFFLRQIIQVASNLLVHMNYRLPDKIDAIVGTVFITPNIHQVHHHYQQPYTDTNYGDVLSIWDHMFGTFCKLPHEEIVFGVDTYMDKKENSKYLMLLKMPFGKYRKVES